MWKIGSKNIFKFCLCAGLLLTLATPLYARSYFSFLREWTRHTQLFNMQTLQTKIIVKATYFSPEFRKAYEEEHIKKKYLGPVAAALYVEQQEQQQAAGDEFFVGFYARKPFKDFSLGKESFWEAVLTKSDGEELHPVRIEQVPIAPYERVMFPYLNRWSYGYRVVFPKSNLKGPFTLTMRSVIGQTHLKWD